MNIKVRVLEDFYITDLEVNDVWFRKDEEHELYVPEDDTRYAEIKNQNDNEFYDVCLFKKDKDSKTWFGDDDVAYLIEV